MNKNEYKESDFRKDKTSAFMNAKITFYYKITQDIGNEKYKIVREGTIRADNLDVIAEHIKGEVEEYSDEFKQE